MEARHDWGNGKRNGPELVAKAAEPFLKSKPKGATMNPAEQKIEASKADYAGTKEQLKNLSPELAAGFPDAESLARPELPREKFSHLSSELTVGLPDAGTLARPER